MRPGFLINEGMHEILLIYEEAICHIQLFTRSYPNVPLFFISVIEARDQCLFSADSLCQFLAIRNPSFSLSLAL